MPKHIHAELMAEYAKDAMETDKPWERWEVEDSLAVHGWVTLTKHHPLWIATLKYRRKPKSSRERFEGSWKQVDEGDSSLDRNPYSGPAEYRSIRTERAWRIWQEAERQAKDSGDTAGGE